MRRARACGGKEGRDGRESSGQRQDRPQEISVEENRSNEKVSGKEDRSIEKVPDKEDRSNDENGDSLQEGPGKKLLSEKGRSKEEVPSEEDRSKEDGGQAVSQKDRGAQDAREESRWPKRYNDGKEEVMTQQPHDLSSSEPVDIRDATTAAAEPGHSTAGESSPPANGATSAAKPSGDRPPGWLQVSPFGRFVHACIHKLWDLTVEGADNIPTGGPVIMAPNHLSFIDSPFMMATVPRRLLAIGKGEYMDDWHTRWFPAYGMVPIDRSGGSASANTLNTAVQLINAGEALLIYPEGTRTRDGALRRGRTGAVRMALSAGCPIVPVGIVGTDIIQPVDQFMPNLRKPATMRFGKPLDIPKLANGRDDRRTLRNLTDELMFEICDLSGQVYTDSYATEDAA